MTHIQTIIQIAFLVGLGFAGGWFAAIMWSAELKAKTDIVASVQDFWRKSRDPHYTEALWGQIDYSKADMAAREYAKRDGGYYRDTGPAHEVRRVALAKRHIYLHSPDDAESRARGLAWLTQVCADEEAARKMGVDL